jgi:signal transduction histidine kinase
MKSRKFNISIAYKIGLMVLVLSVAIFSLLYLYNRFVNYPLLLQSSQVQVREIGNLFREDIEIMLSFEDREGVEDILDRMVSIKNIVGVAVTKGEKLEFENGEIVEEALYKNFQEVSLFEKNLIHSFRIEDFQITLFYSAKQYLEMVELYKTFSIFLLFALLFLSAIFFFAIRRITSFFETLSKKLQEIDFANFQPIELTSIKSNDEREYILRGVRELLLRVQSEISKNREKDRVMFQQARLAQMGEMIGNIAHQWRQPLNEIALLVQSFEMAYYRDKIDEEFVEKRIKESEELVDKMSQTIDDFREFFNPNKEKDFFYLQDSIESALKLLWASFENNSIKVKENFGDSVKIFGYKNEFEQVIVNILSNSKDVLINSEERAVKIEIFRETESVQISISDTGGGILEENLQRVFEPYFTTKEQGKGTGIGLYMSQAIIKNMGGKIDVRNLEKGAEFQIVLPVE